MTYKELADILAATTWPATVLVICLVFRSHLVALLQALTIKPIKLKLLGAEIELTAEQAARALNGPRLGDIARTGSRLHPQV